MSFVARCVHTYEEFVFMREATAVQHNDSDRTKTQIIKRRIKKILFHIIHRGNVGFFPSLASKLNYIRS